MTPYQFAILRYRHSAPAGELVNIGLVMWVPSEARLQYKLNARYGRLSKFYAGFDGVKYRDMLRRLDHHFSGMTASDRQLQFFAHQKYALDDFLSQLLRRDDSCFQWSEIMAGISPRPNERLAELFSEFVTKFEEGVQRQRRDDDDVWRLVDAKLEERGLNARVQKHVEIKGENYAYSFRTGWKNGTRQVLEPISFDFVHPKDIVEKATTWSGRLFNLRARPFKFIGVLSAPRNGELSKAYDRALKILRAAPQVRQLFSEQKVDEVLDMIRQDTEGRD